MGSAVHCSAVGWKTGHSGMGLPRMRCSVFLRIDLYRADSSSRSWFCSWRLDGRRWRVDVRRPGADMLCVLSATAQKNNRPIVDAFIAHSGRAAAQTRIGFLPVGALVHETCSIGWPRRVRSYTDDDDCVLLHKLSSNQWWLEVPFAARLGTNLPNSASLTAGRFWE